MAGASRTGGVIDDTADFKLLVVQYGGNLLDAHRTRENGGEETYHAHEYMLDSLANLRAEFGPTALLSCLSGAKYDETIDSGVRFVGVDLDPVRDSKRIADFIATFNPTHAVLMTPVDSVLQALLKRTDAKVLCTIADSFGRRSFRRRVKNRILARRLNDRRVEWVANHGRNACDSLLQIGVHPTKVLPWDWPHARRPSENPIKTLDPNSKKRVFYAGMLVDPKGVGDAIRATKILIDRGVSISLTLAGDGERPRFEELSRTLGISKNVKMLGRVPNSRVFAEMLSSTAVLVPSHHDYPEGLPLTIYEAFASRTPVIASDHPMFRGVVNDRISGLIHPQKSPEKLASCIELLCTDPVLYARLSVATHTAWRSLLIESTWAEVIARWCRDREGDREWLASHALVRNPA